MQAISDKRRKFTAFDMRPGSYTDKKLWNASVVGRNARQILPHGCHFLGDADYTLLCEVMTPYLDHEEGGDLNERQLRYNFVQSSTRMAVECAFGMLGSFTNFKATIRAKKR